MGEVKYLPHDTQPAALDIDLAVAEQPTVAAPNTTPLTELIRQHHYRRRLAVIIEELRANGYDTKGLESLMEKSRWQTSDLLDNL
jgi:hypothetical protein